MYTVSNDSVPAAVIKHSPDDFVVEEIDRGMNVCAVDGDYSMSCEDASGANAGDFVHAVLIKKNIDTISAVRKICDALNVSDKRVSYAGVKDKAAFTAQRISFYKMELVRISGISFPDMRIIPVGHGDKVYLGDLWGNRFTICVRGIQMDKAPLKKHIDSVLGRLDGVFPNYFGEQRFGSVRPVTLDVGIEILRGDIGRALEVYVSKVYDSENEDIRKIREVAWADKKKGLELFPRGYIYERLILNHLVSHDGDYRGAFMQIPLGLRKMFVNSVQSHIFNLVLERMIADGACRADVKIPIVGYIYANKLLEEDSDRYVDDVLDSLGITPSMFKIRGFDELSSKGEYRDGFQKFGGFEVLSIGSDDVLSGNKVVMRFSIPKGSYATVFLREFFKF